MKNKTKKPVKIDVILEYYRYLLVELDWVSTSMETVLNFATLADRALSDELRTQFIYDLERAIQDCRIDVRLALKGFKHTLKCFDIEDTDNEKTEG
ncbi:MAG: hypothetical protein H7A25_22340 [Leptospiraceae bacterium]|nr:hypothetical protein [Leptospiraceae bacterium]MCP5502654.1 hypothetical protein [Leptospiraceae bacterium]